MFLWNVTGRSLLNVSAAVRIDTRYDTSAERHLIYAVFRGNAKEPGAIRDEILFATPDEAEARRFLRDLQGKLERERTGSGAGASRR
jgi:hypothetical protein